MIYEDDREEAEEHVKLPVLHKFMVAHAEEKYLLGGKAVVDVGGV